MTSYSIPFESKEEAPKGKENEREREMAHTGSGNVGDDGHNMD